MKLVDPTAGAEWTDGQRGDLEGLSDEPAMETATLEQAMLWRQVYLDLRHEAQGILDHIEEAAVAMSEVAGSEVAAVNQGQAARQVVRYRRRGQAWMARIEGLSRLGDPTSGP